LEEIKLWEDIDSSINPKEWWAIYESNEGKQVQVQVQLQDKENDN